MYKSLTVRENNKIKKWNSIFCITNTLRERFRRIGRKNNCCHYWLTAYTTTKIPFMYSQKRNCAASVQFPHSCAFQRFIYIPRIGPHIFLQQNRQTHECGNWDRGRAIPFPFRVFGIVSLQCTLNSSEFVLQHMYMREGLNTVDEGHGKKLLKLHLANFLHASTDILEDFGLDLYGYH
jgi:hypothetical protein